MITVRRASGIAVPFDPPEVTVEAAIERSWEMMAGGGLLWPKPREYLPTAPIPDPGYFRLPHWAGYGRGWL